jgi:phosphoglycolate phosphatase-like HAD superfamily hydrolase
MQETQNRFSAVQIFIFDPDGTLIDSKLDLANSVNATLDRVSRHMLPHKINFGQLALCFSQKQRQQPEQRQRR